MSFRQWAVVVGLATLLAVPQASAGQTFSSSLQGGVWGGLYFPNDDPLYSTREPADRGSFSDRYSVAAIRDGGWLVGASGSVRPEGWPVRVRGSLAQARGVNVAIQEATAGAGGICLDPGGCVAGAVWSSDLTVSVAQVDAITRPLGSIGPVDPRLVVGLSAQHRSYGSPVVAEVLGTPTTQDTAGARVPDNQLSGAVHLGPEVGMDVLGVSTYARFGDFIFLDDSFRHDLYVVLGAMID